MTFKHLQRERPSYCVKCLQAQAFFVFIIVPTNIVQVFTIIELMKYRISVITNFTLKEFFQVL